MSLIHNQLNASGAPTVCQTPPQKAEYLQEKHEEASFYGSPLRNGDMSKNCQPTFDRFGFTLSVADSETLLDVKTNCESEADLQSSCHPEETFMSEYTQESSPKKLLDDVVSGRQKRMKTHISNVCRNEFD